MPISQKKNSTILFLIHSFIGLLLFGIVVFSILGIYMDRKSKDTIYEVGEIYMSGMNEQMSRHFESVIKLRFDQVDGIISTVSEEASDRDSIYEELIYRAQIRNFDYLALCSDEGYFETLYGESIQPTNPGPFVDALINGEQSLLKQLLIFFFFLTIQTLKAKLFCIKQGKKCHVCSDFKVIHYHRSISYRNISLFNQLNIILFNFHYFVK